jgi:hypothetical protein
LPTLTRRSASRSHIRNLRFLGTAEILKTDVLGSVVVGVVLVATIQTLELLAVAVVVVGKRWTGGILVVLEAFDAAFDCFDGLANPLLDEICGQLRILT